LLDSPWGIAVDGTGNVYVLGSISDNAFKVKPDGTIRKFIDSTGDGMGNTLDQPDRIVVDGSESVYLSGTASDNAFLIPASDTPVELLGFSIDWDRQ